MITRKMIIISISMCIVIGASFWGINYFIKLQKYKDTVKSISISNVDLSKTSDGTYSGSCDAIMVGADVSVTVKDHKITDIKLLNHKTERGQKAEVLPQKVLDKQSLEVDAVSGATNSSKVILKAIENALEKGK